MPAVNLRESLHLQVVHSPQRVKTCDLIKNRYHATLILSSKPEQYDCMILVSRYYNMDAQYQRCTYSKGATL